MDHPIARALTYIDDHLSQALHRSKLAELAGIHPDHFSRLFKRYTGMTPSAYVVKARIEAARLLLAQNRHTVAEVARQVGFDDPYYFSRCFKAIVGVAPTAYMESPGIRIAALDGAGHCAALGVMPVGYDRHASGACLAHRLRHIPDLAVDRSAKVDLQQLAALKPDVIIAMDRDLPGLQEIAPVLTLNVLDDPIYGQLRQISKYLGREQIAADWIANYEENSRQQRMRLGLCRGQRVAVLRVREPLLQVYGMQNMGYPLYRALQLMPPERIEVQHMCNAHFHSSPITAEELPFYRADHLFVVVQPDAGARRRWQSLQMSPYFRQHPAVARGQVYHLDVSRWLAYDPLSISMQMDEAVYHLTSGSERRNSPSVMQAVSMD